jgi:hypothetical protein
MDLQQQWMVNPYSPIVNKTFCKKPTINRRIRHTIITIKNRIHIHQSLQKVHPPQKFKCSPLWNTWSYNIKEYGIEVASVITSKQNDIQIHQSAKKLHHLTSLNIRHFGVINVTFNVIISIQNFIQIHQSVQTLSGAFYTHLRGLNVRHLGMDHGTELENMASRSS